MNACYGKWPLASSYTLFKFCLAVKPPDYYKYPQHWVVQHILKQPRAWRVLKIPSLNPQMSFGPPSLPAKSSVLSKPD